jgi:hypothetical protein
MAKLTLRRRHTSRGKGRGKSRILGHKRKSRIQRGGNKEKRYSEYYNEIISCTDANNKEGFCPSIHRLISPEKLLKILRERVKLQPTLRDVIMNTTLTMTSADMRFFSETTNKAGECGWFNIIRDWHNFVHRISDWEIEKTRRELGIHTIRLMPDAGTKTLAERPAAGASATGAATARPSTRPSTRPAATAETIPYELRKIAPPGWKQVGNIWQSPDGIQWANEDMYRYPTGDELSSRLAAALKDD